MQASTRPQKHRTKTKSYSTRRTLKYTIAPGLWCCCVRASWNAARSTAHRHLVALLSLFLVSRPWDIEPDTLIRHDQAYKLWFVLAANLPTASSHQRTWPALEDYNMPIALRWSFNWVCCQKGGVVGRNERKRWLRWAVTGWAAIAFLEN